MADQRTMIKELCAGMRCERAERCSKWTTNYHKAVEADRVVPAPFLAVRDYSLRGKCDQFESSLRIVKKREGADMSPASCNGTQAGDAASTASPTVLSENEQGDKPGMEKEDDQSRR